MERMDSIEARIELEKELTHPVRRTRLHELAYHPSQMTAEERSHIMGCDQCQRRLASVRRVVHPSATDVYIEYEDRKAVAEHCSQCDECYTKLRQWLHLVTPRK